jgi:hypothetical protein
MSSLYVCAIRDPFAIEHDGEAAGSGELVRRARNPPQRVCLDPEHGDRDGPMLDDDRRGVRDHRDLVHDVQLGDRALDQRLAHVGLVDAARSAIGRAEAPAIWSQHPGRMEIAVVGGMHRE